MSRRRKRWGRDINGILILDKPIGLSSNQALQKVKRFYNANKAGHTGSLDVPATGVLPICLGEATKVSAYLLNADKYYRTRCKLGIITTTGDATGTVLEQKKIPNITEHDLERVLKKFIGKIKQIPPMFSALKYNGKPLYELAYQGIEIKREPRDVVIYELDLIDLLGDEFEIAVHSSKGTYIRTLVQDIGDRLGCGAHVISLRRLASGPFQEQQMISLVELEAMTKQGFDKLDSLLLPIDWILYHFPKVDLNEQMVHCLYQGQTVKLPNLPNEGRLRIYNQFEQFIGLGEVISDGRIRPKRLINL